MSCFISYKNETGMLYAREIANFMRSKKIPYFLDTDVLPWRTGNYKKILRQEISKADDFLLLLTPNAVDSLPPDSVFLEEITFAMSLGKNIIPIFFGGFSFPAVMPDGLKEIKDLEGVMQRKVSICYDEILQKMTQSEEVNKAYHELTSFTYLENREDVEAMYSLQERLSGEIESISLSALACQGMLNANRAYLEHVIQENPNCKIRVVMLDPKSAAAEEAAKHKIRCATVEASKAIIKTTYDYNMKEWCETYPNNFEGRQTDWYLPSAIFIVKKRNKKESTVKVDFYSFHCHDRERRCALIKATDYDNFKFYCKQFEYIWKNAKPYMSRSKKEGEHND